MNNHNIDKMVNATEVFNDNKNILLNNYIEDYGIEYKKHIEDNLNSTIYIFDSTPDVNYDFFVDNYDKINNQKLFDMAEEEYKDYILMKDKIEHKLIKEFNNVVAYHTRSNNILGREYWNLDMECFDFNSYQILNDSEASKKDKRNILKRRKKYLDRCNKLKLVPITNWKSIASILYCRDILKDKEKEYLIRYTIWGRRIANDIFNEYNYYLNSRYLSKYLFSNLPGKTVYHKTNRGYKKICHVPLIKNGFNTNLDVIVLHELRHVIESSDIGCGLTLFNNEKYRIINEINTQSNATKDLSRVDELFSKNENNNFVTSYDLLLPYTDDFFNKNKDILNECAISNNIELFEEYFNKDELSDFNSYLSDIHKNIIKTRSSINNSNDLKKLKIKRNI